MIPIQEENYTFDDLDELYETAEDLPEVERQPIYARHEGLEEYEKIPYRNSLWTDDGRATSDVSASKDFYHVIQYGDILDTVGTAIEQHQDAMEHGVDGSVSLSPSAHKMSAEVNFEGDTTVYADEDDPVDLGLKIRSGHSGFHGLKYDVGAERQICSNGMMAFISDLSFNQTHGDGFQPGLAYHAVDAVVESPDVVEERLEKAQNRELMNRDEALLVLIDTGIDHYLDDPVPDLVNALVEEVDDPDSPTLWETYNAATRALTHYTRDYPDYKLDQGYEQAAQILENGRSGVPEPLELGGQAVENRVDHVIENQGSEEYWDGEQDALRELMEAHNSPA